MSDPTHELEQIYGTDRTCGICGDTGYIWGDPKNGECGRCYDPSVDDRYVKWSETEGGDFLVLEVTCRRCGRKEDAKDETIPDCWWQIDQLCGWDTNEIHCRDCKDRDQDGQEAGRDGDYRGDHA